MNLYLYTDTVGPEHFPLIRSLKSMGAEGVEIPLVFGQPQRLPELRQMLDDEGLGRTTLSSVTAADALDRIKWAVDGSHALGSTTLSGPLYAAALPAAPGGPTSDAMKRSAETLNLACAYAAPAGVRLCLEFLNRFESYLVNTAEQTAALIDQVQAPNLAIAYDTHHANIEEHDIPGSIAAAGARLAHTHISENHRGTLGTGVMDWAKIFHALKTNGYSGWLMVEAFATDVRSLAQFAHVWRDNFSSKDEVARRGLPFMREQWDRA